jgi:hypothetical protein
VFPPTGNLYTIYIDSSINALYFWDGTEYQELGRSQLFGYQDFAAGSILGTTITVDSNENGTNAQFLINDIYAQGSIVNADGPSTYVYTTGVGGFFSKLVAIDSVVKNANSLTITLNRIPNPATNIRIYYPYYGAKPNNYDIPPQNILDAHGLLVLEGAITPDDIAGFNEAIDDEVNALIQDNTGITWIYDDTLATLTPVLDDNLIDIVNAAPSSGNILIGSGTQWSSVAMSGDATIVAGGALTLASIAVAASTGGSASKTIGITYDAKGRITSSTITNIAISASQVSVTDGQIIIGNASNVGASVAMSGGVNISNSGVATVITNANLTGVITSVGNVTSIASQTGTGTKFVVDTSPEIISPAFTGSPIAPTQNPNTGTDLIATCQYVNDLIDNLPLGTTGDMTNTDLLVVDINGDPRLFTPVQLEATNTVSGFMSSTDKIKLDNSDNNSFIYALIL